MMSLMQDGIEGIPDILESLIDHLRSPDQVSILSGYRARYCWSAQSVIKDPLFTGEQKNKLCEET